MRKTTGIASHGQMGKKCHQGGKVRGEEEKKTDDCHSFHRQVSYPEPPGESRTLARVGGLLIMKTGYSCTASVRGRMVSLTQPASRMDADLGKQRRKLGIKGMGGGAGRE